MKNSIKLFFVFSFIFLSFNTFSQTYIRGGFNLSNMSVKDNDGTYSDDLKFNPGFHFGITVNEELSDWALLETGLLISKKGFKYSDDSNPRKVKEQLNLNYVQLPINFKVFQSSEEESKAKLYGLFGPYLGMGISGKSIFESTYQGNTVTNETYINFGDDELEDDFKKFDLGLTIGFGLMTKNFQVGLDYDIGLANIAHTSDNGFKMNNRVFKLTLAHKVNF